MANIENNPEKNDNQRSEFAINQELKANVYDAIEERLKSSTEKALKEEGLTLRKIEDQKGEQGWNRGVYGDGSMYGVGSSKGQATVTINRVKGSKATNGFFEKNISIGAKKMVVEIHVDIEAESKTMDMTYKTTEDSFFRGHHDKKGPFMIDDKLVFNLESMDKFKKELKEKFDKYAVREANYLIKTKIGIEDRIEKSINSMVETNMKKLSLKDILKSDFDETLDRVMESAKKKKDDEIELNHPEVKKANSPDNLLFDDLDEAEKSKGKDYRDYFEGKMKEFGAKSPKELKPSEFTSINMGWESKEEKGIDEISSVGGAGSVGGFQYDAPLGGSKRTIKDTEYGRKKKKRRLKRENKDGWTTVELDAGGYAPKGMDQNYAMGLSGVEVNSKEEDELSKGSPKGRAAMNENVKPSKRKFISEAEHKELGINKRYIITKKLNESEEKENWRKLSNFEKNSTIRLAECVNPNFDMIDSEDIVSREEGEDRNHHEFIKRNSEVDHGDEVNGKKVIVVSKPNSLTNATFKVFEDDYLNENKAFILDLQTGNLVNNPNYKTK